jgi:ribose-phosphate pyrophosphokinase
MGDMPMGSLLGTEFLPARPPPAQESEPMGTFHEDSPRRRMMVFSGRSNPDLAARIAAGLNMQLGRIRIKTFPNGEIYVRYEESIRGTDVFLIQSGSAPVNANLMELLIMVNAARLASAKRVTVVMPWYPYSRQDKKSSPREPITARLVAELLESAGADRVLTMDLHAGQVQGFFRIPVDHMTALPQFAQHFRDIGLTQERLVVVSADVGRTKLSSKFADLIGAELAILTKDRPEHGQAVVTNIIGDVRDRVALIYDDMIDTAGTLCAGAQAIKDAGAERVLACATHGVFSADALTTLEESVLERVVVTDTIPVDPVARPDKVEVLSVAGILAETIDNVFHDDSVSAIFKGENQLF